MTLLIETKMLLAFLTSRALCWLTFNLLPTRNSQVLLCKFPPSQQASSLYCCIYSTPGRGTAMSLWWTSTDLFVISTNWSIWMAAHPSRTSAILPSIASSTNQLSAIYECNWDSPLDTAGWDIIPSIALLQLSAAWNIKPDSKFAALPSAQLGAAWGLAWRSTSTRTQAPAGCQRMLPWGWLSSSYD